MAYSIGQLALIHESRNPDIYCNSDRADDQPICYSSEYEDINRAFRSKRTVAVTHGAGRVWILQGGMP